jgi:APA family basic amino acid/polyamine antiporter
MPPSGKLGLGTGIGLVVANMIGAGVFLSAGFMAQDLAALPILLAWGVGLVLALCGSLVYAHIARAVPRSGGEYRYLSELVHPAVGYLAGWASMLIGFSGPIAIDALAAGAFFRQLVPGAPPQLLAVAIIVVITALHAFDLRWSKTGQNVLVAIKACLVIAFVALGLSFGNWDWPEWQPPAAAGGFSWAPFMASLFFIAFAFSGWNATAYAADEFERPERDVPRAMLIGCAGVGFVYLLVNWVFVANLSPEQAKVVFKFDSEKITLAHVIARELIGEGGAKVISALMVIAFLSAASAMTFVGPRVYAAMAADGFLPRQLRQKHGRPPIYSVLLQGALALTILYTQPLQNILHDVGGIVVLFSALTALSVFLVRRRGRVKVPYYVLCAAGLYVASAAWMLYFGFHAKTHLLTWVAIIVAVGLAAFALTRALGSRRRNAEYRTQQPS